MEFYELTIRLIPMLTKNNGKPRYPIIAPVFYFAITPTFYLGLWLVGLDKREANNAGYFSLIWRLARLKMLLGWEIARVDQY